MKAALIALVLTVITPVHITGALAGVSVSFPSGWLILAGEVLIAAAVAWLAARELRRFRSSPYLRSAFPAGGPR